MTYPEQSTKNDVKTSSTLKDKFAAFFFWASPLGLIADLISILGLLNFKNQFVAQQIQSLSPIYTEPKVFGFLGMSDAVVLTGFITLLIVVSTIYGSIILAQNNENYWPYIWGSFITLVLSWFYFRLWLGEYGWIWILLAFVLICVITTYLLSNTDVPPDRVGCMIATLSLIILTIFLMAATGAWNRIASHIDSLATTSSSVNIPSQPAQRVESTPFATAISNAEPPSLQPYVSYELSPASWFPMPSEVQEGLFAGNAGEVTNEKASWGNADALRLFQSWGRITSYERFYSHQNGCNSDNIKSVYIQIIFFKTAEGSKSFFDWANEDASVKFVNNVGDNAYIYSENKADGDCQISLVSTTFQRYNIITRVRVNTVEGKLSYDAAESLSLKIAHLLDERLKSEAK